MHEYLVNIVKCNLGIWGQPHVTHVWRATKLVIGYVVAGGGPHGGADTGGAIRAHKFWERWRRPIRAHELSQLVGRRLVAARARKH